MYVPILVNVSLFCSITLSKWDSLHFNHFIGMDLGPYQRYHPDDIIRISLSMVICVILLFSLFLFKVWLGIVSYLSYFLMFLSMFCAYALIAYITKSLVTSVYLFSLFQHHRTTSRVPTRVGLT